MGDITEDTKAEVGAVDWDGESTVTTWTTGGWKSNARYYLPTWPGLPWGGDLFQVDPEDSSLIKGYPCFPWGGIAGSAGNSWNDYNAGDSSLPDCGGSLVNRFDSYELGQERNWFVEEARIRGGYNETSVDFGVKAYLVEDENLQENRINALIYSGIFNSTTGVNNTNVFNTAEPITKALDPQNGSIQKLYAYDTNLTIFQENKVSRALIDKDAIYSAEGQGTPVTSAQVVIGQIVPYAGEYGISTNPESWAQYGFRQYFSDRFRNAIMRLSRDGLTEISNYGMTNFFRDNLSLIKSGSTVNVLSYLFFDDGIGPGSQLGSFEIINNADCDCTNIEIGSLLRINDIEISDIYVIDVAVGVNCLIKTSKEWNPTDYGLADDFSLLGNIEFVRYNKDRILGGFDTYNKNYVISIQEYQPSTECVANLNNSTLSFDESINGWVSFYSYTPTFLNSVKNEFFSGDGYKLYKHYSQIVPRGSFYGVEYPSSIEFIFNPNPSVVKNFLTINYEGSNGWQVDYLLSDATEFENVGVSWFPIRDSSNFIYSYDQGVYLNPAGYTERGGFDRKENRYVTNLINNSSPAPGEIIFGNAMSGVKGYFVTVRLSTDVNTVDSLGNPLEPTDLGGMKELYSVGTHWVVSST